MEDFQRFENARDYAKNLIHAVKEKPWHFIEKGKDSPSDLLGKLTELYADPSVPRHEEFTRSNLLKKLVVKEEVNCLVVDLYPGNAGYTITVKTRNGQEAETKHLLYCEDEQFLNCIDNGEIPPFLMQWFPYCRDDLFHNGCIVAEVRDRRTSLPGSGLYDSKYVLLKPTTQSDICEIDLLTKGESWDMQQLNKFESEFTLNTAEPLCLDPSPAVAVIANYLQLQKNPLARESILRHVKQCNPLKKNRKRKFPRSQSGLYNYFSKHDAVQVGKAFPASATISLPDSSLFGNGADFYFDLVDYKLNEEQVLASPKSEHSKEDGDILDEEYKMEIERNRGVIQCTTVAIMKVPADEVYYGILSLNCEGEDHWTSSQFFLGSKAVVDKYIKQFKKIFTEDGCKNVKITHEVPGCAPEVYFTPAARERGQNSQSFFSSIHANKSASPSMSAKPHSNFSVESIISSASSAGRSAEQFQSSLRSERLTKSNASGSSPYRNSPVPCCSTDDVYMAEYGSGNSQDLFVPATTSGTSSSHNSDAAMIVALAGLWSFQAINAQSFSSKPSVIPTQDTNIFDLGSLSESTPSVAHGTTASQTTFLKIMNQIKRK